MKRGVVKSITSDRSRCSVLLFDDVTVRAIIPEDNREVSVGSVVLITEKDNILVATLSSPKEEKDPIMSDIGKDAAGDGDLVLQKEGTGFITALRGFFASLGGSPLAQIQAYGSKKLLKFIGERIVFDGGDNMSADIDGSGGSPPQVSMHLGAIRISSNSMDEFTISIFDEVSVSVSDKHVEVAITVMTDDGKKTNRYSTKRGPDGKARSLINLASKITATLQDISMSAKNISLSGNEYSIKGKSKSENFDDKVEQRTKSKTVNVQGLYKMSANNVKFTLGGEKMMGKFLVQAGPGAGINVDSLGPGTTSIKGVAGINLNGTDNFAVNGIQYTMVMQQVMAALMNLSMGLPLPGPLALPFAVSALTATITATATLPFCLNPFVRIGTFPQPFI